MVKKIKYNGGGESTFKIVATSSFSVYYNDFLLNTND
jgi:hypothetical protein